MQSCARETLITDQSFSKQLMKLIKSCLALISASEKQVDRMRPTRVAAGDQMDKLEAGYDKEKMDEEQLMYLNSKMQRFTNIASSLSSMFDKSVTNLLDYMKKE